MGSSSIHGMAWARFVWTWLYFRHWVARQASIYLIVSLRSLTSIFTTRCDDIPTSTHTPRPLSLGRPATSAFPFLHSPWSTWTPPCRRGVLSGKGYLSGVSVLDTLVRLFRMAQGQQDTNLTPPSRSGLWAVLYTQCLSPCFSFCVLFLDRRRGEGKGEGGRGEGGRSSTLRGKEAVPIHIHTHTPLQGWLKTAGRTRGNHHC